MVSARDDAVQSLHQLAAAAQELASSATEVAAAIAEDPPHAARINKAVQSYVAHLKAQGLPARVASQALKRWALLNPGVSQEKIR